MRRAVRIFILICWSAWAQEPGLRELRAALEALRPHQQEHRGTRGATPELTAIKHRLRDWAEARLAAFSESTDEDAFNRDLQEAMGSAGLLCPDGCPLTALGYVDRVRVHRQHEFLAVQTSVGIGCGYDDSVYLYERGGKLGRRSSWIRIFEAEQNNYTKTGYLPQTVYAVQISPPGAQGRRMILSLGSRVSCASAFQPIYYRLWKLGSGGGQPKLLLDASETAYMGAYPPVRATLSPEEVRVEFSAGGTGYGSGHEAVRHFKMVGNSVKQVEPIAPTPRDFVEEWLAAPWKRSARYSESSALQSWHRKLHRDDGLGDFPDPTLPCSSGLWQVGIRLHGVDGETYYQVRWRQPDHFTMVAIADHPLCK